MPSSPLISQFSVGLHNARLPTSVLNCAANASIALHSPTLRKVFQDFPRRRSKAHDLRVDFERRDAIKRAAHRRQDPSLVVAERAALLAEATKLRTLVERSPRR
jgi:hypothetical protein